MPTIFRQTGVSDSFTFDDYSRLTKPGLLFWVYLSALVGYVFSAETIRISDMLLLFVGIYLSGAAAHIFNQYLERDADAKMKRTKTRPFVLGKLTSGSGFFIGMSMFLSGYVCLFIAFNPLTAFLSLLTFVLYVFLYTPMKKKSVWNTWAGAIPGAIPALIGGAAASGVVTNEALYFFVVLFFWQIPHFLALAWKYRFDYNRANFKMLPTIDKNGHYTLLIIGVHSLSLGAVCFAAPVLFDGLGVTYVVLTTLIMTDLAIKIVRFWLERTDKNAMKIFFNSIYFIPILYGAFVVDTFLF